MPKGVSKKSKVSSFTKCMEQSRIDQSEYHMSQVIFLSNLGPQKMQSLVFS